MIWMVEMHRLRLFQAQTWTCKSNGFMKDALWRCWLCAPSALPHELPARILCHPWSSTNILLVGCHRRELTTSLSKALEGQGGSFGLLVSTKQTLALLLSPSGRTHPSSKCLHLLRASCALVLHFTHSNRSTTFFVVFAFLWKTGFVWPPYPDYFRSYPCFPWATGDACHDPSSDVSFSKLSPNSSSQPCTESLYAVGGFCTPEFAQHWRWIWNESWRTWSRQKVLLIFETLTWSKDQ